MSKVVTIPKDRNPFVVIVNGVKHSYPAGVSTEVPDEVADVIEKYVGAKPKPDPNAGINFGGTQSDWNQTDSAAADFIKNKPFYYSPTGGDTLYWDGNTEGLVPVGGMLFKLSEATPTMDDMADGVTVQVYAEGQWATGIMPAAEMATGIILITNTAVVVSEEGVGVEVEGMVFTETGLYLMVPFPIYLTIPGYTGFPVTKKMEEKYLPGAVILYAHPTDINDMYLYITADASKKVTRAELMEYLRSGRTIYLLLDGYSYCNATAIVDSDSCAGILLSFMGEDYQFVTAEYVPETTE